MLFDYRFQSLLLSVSLLRSCDLMLFDYRFQSRARALFIDIVVI